MREERKKLAEKASEKPTDEQERPNKKKTKWVMEINSRKLSTLFM
jgi:hypothetical protein